MKKQIILLLFNIIFCVGLNAQNKPLFDRVLAQSQKIKSGSYIIERQKKFFDSDKVIFEKLDVKFCEVGNNTICLIKDLVNERVLFFDTTIWTYEYRFKDSTLNIYVKYNPNQDLLYTYMQPYGFLNTFGLHFQLPVLENKMSLTVKWPYDSYDEIHTKNSFLKFEIDSSFLIPIKYQNYSEEWLDSVNFNVQNMVEEITDLQLNNINPWLLLQHMNNFKKSLPITKEVYPNYSKIVSKPHDTLDLERWNLRNTKSSKFVKVDKNKPTFLYFTYMGCLPCKYALPSIDSIYQKWGHLVNFYAVDLFDTNLSKLEIYKKANNTQFDYLYSNDDGMKKDFSAKYKIASYPTFLIVNSSGKIVFRKEGFKNSFMEEIDLALKLEIK